MGCLFEKKTVNNGISYISTGAGFLTVEQWKKGPCLGYFSGWNLTELCERPPKPPTFWNSYTRTLILDTIMKLSGTIGVTQKTMTFDTHVCLILLQTLNPQERWGTHKKRWPFQPRPFADVIGLVRWLRNINLEIWTPTLTNQDLFLFRNNNKNSQFMFWEPPQFPLWNFHKKNWRMKRLELKNHPCYSRKIIWSIQTSMI